MVDERKDEPKDGPKTEAPTPKQIREAVEERIRQESAAYPDPSKNNGTIPSAYVQQCLTASELGDGLLFAAVNKNRFIYNVSTGEWYEWHEHFWRRDLHDQALAGVENVVTRLLEETTELSKKIDWTIKKQDKDLRKKLEDQRYRIYRRIKTLRTMNGRDRCLRGSRSCNDPITIEGAAFDALPMYLACKNGVMDLESGKFRPGRQSDFMSMACPTEWKGWDEPATEWEKFLLDIFAGDEDLITFMHRLLGYAITGLTTEHIMPVLWGKGRNGKGTLVETFIHVLGPLACPVQAELLLSEWRPRSASAPSPDIMALKGLRIAFASETDEGRHFSSAKVKWLTGGDQLVGRNPHDRHNTHFAPTHTLFLMTNNKPGVSSGDDFAFWERMLLIPFTMSFINREPKGRNERRAVKDIKETLQEEASGILAWLVKGCLDYQKNGLPLPEAVTKATLEYREDEDLLGQFVDGYLVRDTGAKTTSADLYDLFNRWYKKFMSSKGISHKRFGSMMKKKFNPRKIGGNVHYIGVEIDPVKAADLRGED